jgi:hypothetical protein
LAETIKIEKTISDNEPALVDTALRQESRARALEEIEQTTSDDNQKYWDKLELNGEV